MSLPSIDGLPVEAGIWTDIAPVLSGWAPHDLVTVQARIELDPDHVLSSRATLFTDESGRADLAEQAPVNGSYHVADPNGLLWSMEPEGAWEFPGLGGLRTPRPFSQLDLSPYAVEFTASSSTASCTARITRTVLANGVRRIPVDEPGLAATLFLPPGPGPHPTLIQFGGSGGGIQERRAAQYAAHGWASLALGYFAVPGATVPPTLDEIPLEYFREAVAWLRRRPGLSAETVGLAGTSRGGELALLLGSHFPDFSPVIAWVPSHVTWGTHAQPGGDPRGRSPSWTLAGEPVPFVPPVSQPGDFVLRDGVSTHTQAFLRNLSAVIDPARYEIAVERITGPVLLIGADDDALWPSGWFARQARRRLDTRGPDHASELLTFPSAGHSISFENEPTTFLTVGDDTTHADRGSLTPAVTDTFHMGGTPHGNARAAARLRNEVWRFLAESRG